jgi:hypothetical protein
MAYISVNKTCERREAVSEESCIDGSRWRGGEARVGDWVGFFGARWDVMQVSLP